MHSMISVWFLAHIETYNTNTNGFPADSGIKGTTRPTNFKPASLNKHFENHVDELQNHVDGQGGECVSACVEVLNQSHVRLFSISSPVCVHGGLYTRPDMGHVFDKADVYRILNLK